MVFVVLRLVGHHTRPSKLFRGAYFHCRRAFVSGLTLVGERICLNCPLEFLGFIEGWDNAEQSRIED